MSLIDRPSTFRGKITDHGVSLTRNEFPQFVAVLQATEIYDEDEKVWVDWRDYEENEITAYLVLFDSKDEKTLNCKQVEKVTGWDGASFQVLNDADLSEVGIQFRVESHTYEEKTSLQVSWIDEYGAEPGRTVRKLDPNEMKELDAKYAQLLKAGGAKKAPVKAEGKPKTPGKVTKKDVAPTSPKGPVKKVEKSIPPSLPTPPQSPDLPSGRCSQQEAWDTVNELKAKKVSEDKLADVWLKTIAEIGGGKKQKELIETEWFEVKEKVLAETAIF